MKNKIGSSNQNQNAKRNSPRPVRRGEGKGEGCTRKPSTINHHPSTNLSRNANERLLKIHQLIAAQRFPNTFSLARDLEISRKTLKRDICIISLSSDFRLQTFDFRPSLGRLTYTGGYILPGTTPGPGQTPLPSDLEQAAVEQVAYWFQIRDKLGLKTRWPHGGTYEGFFPSDLLPNVQTTLKKYQRWSL